MESKLTTEFDLRLGDCVEGMKSLPDATVDVIVTSPPYNLGIDYKSFSDDMEREDYLVWSLRWATQAARVMKPGGSLFLNLGGSPSNPYLPHELIIRLRTLFKLQNTLHWIKSITVQPRQGPPISAGHFKPINSKRFITDCHEYVFHLTKNGNVELDRLGVGVEYTDKSNIARWNHTKEDARDLRCRGNNWFIPYKTINSRSSERPHPATFPTQLAEWCLRLHGLRPDLVMLEPFLGIGHAAVAAAECQVKKFIGFEIDEGYLTEARERLGKLQKL